MAMGPRDEYKASYPDPTTGLRWALAVVSVIAVAAVIAAVTLWLKPRHVEQPPPKEKASTGVPRADLEQITGQLLLPRRSAGQSWCIRELRAAALRQRVPADHHHHRSHIANRCQLDL